MRILPVLTLLAFLTGCGEIQPDMQCLQKYAEFRSQFDNGGMVFFRFDNRGVIKDFRAIFYKGKEISKYDSHKGYLNYDHWYDGSYSFGFKHNVVQKDYIFKQLFKIEKELLK